MAHLYPYFFSENSREQANYYAEALNGEVVSVQTFAEAPNMPEEIHHKVMHLVLKAAGHHFFFADKMEGEVINGNHLELTLEFEEEIEAERAFQNLCKEGNVIMPFEKMFWGAMFGRVEDRYGVKWQICTTHHS